MVEQKVINRKGRPRVAIAAESVLIAYGQALSIASAARSLNISQGVAWQRLKELGVTPLGMTPREAGQLGAKCKQIEEAVRQ